jgi:hypothetical protein
MLYSINLTYLSRQIEGVECPMSGCDRIPGRAVGINWGVVAIAVATPTFDDVGPSFASSGRHVRPIGLPSWRRKHRTPNASVAG